MRKRENKNMFLKPEMLIAISAILFSVCALVVSITEVNIMRKQQKATVWPYLELLPSYNESGFYVLMQNKGVGPAIVKSFIFKFDGEIIKTWDDFLIKLFDNDSVSVSNEWTTINGRVIAPNEEIKIIKIESDRAARHAIRNYHRIDIEFCYSSIHNDYWLVNKNNERCSLSEYEIDDEIQFQN